jgi:hypothetical protein
MPLYCRTASSRLRKDARLRSEPSDPTFRPLRGLVGRARRRLRPLRRVAYRALAPVGSRISIPRERARLREAVTFNEKVRYKMLADRRPLLTMFADKVAVRAYVEAKVGASVLTDLYAVTNEPQALMRAELPREFVVKPTHGSGAGVIVAEFVSSELGLPASPAGWAQWLVSPDSLDWDRLVEQCRHWLSLRYRNGKEWAYRDVEPRILVEELLQEDGRAPFDYKFFVFHGRVRMILVDLNRFEAQTRNLYTPGWKRLEVRVTQAPGTDIEPPAALEEMLDIAERLAAETDFVRVDLYCPAGRVVFGELTNYPDAGTTHWEPPEFDRQLGAWWTPPSRYSRR